MTVRCMGRVGMGVCVRACGICFFVETIAGFFVFFIFFVVIYLASIFDIH
jgi:hypothetical protein